MIDEINNNDVNYILVLENSNQTLAESILSNSKCKKGVEILILNSCQSVTAIDAKHLSMLSIMQENLEVLKKVLDK